MICLQDTATSLSGHLGRRGLADPVNTCLPVLVSAWSHKGKSRFEMLKLPDRRAEGVASPPNQSRLSSRCVLTLLGLPLPPARPQGRCWSPQSSDLKAQAPNQWLGARRPGRAQPGPSGPPRTGPRFVLGRGGPAGMARDAGLCCCSPRTGFVPLLFPR